MRGIAVDRRRLRLAVAGCGRAFERFHLPALRRSPDWQVAAVVDPSPERRRWAEAALPGTAAFESLAELLASVEADALLVTSPPESHAELALLGLGRGLHVLVEKPMATSAEEAARLVAASAAARKHLAVGFNRRFRRPYASLRNALESRAGAEVRAARSELVTSIGRWGGSSPGGVPDAPGGQLRRVLLDVAVHQLDLLPWLLGKSLREVKARWLEAGGLDARDGDGAVVMEIDLSLGEGCTARCVAGHGRRYRENLEVDIAGRTLVAGPTACFESSRRPGPWLHGFARARAMGHLLLRRALGRPSVTGESFSAQLDAFAAAARGDDRRFRGATAACGLRSALAIEACLESLAGGGEWRPVRQAAPEPSHPCP
jgi:predicted dehydrogenase